VIEGFRKDNVYINDPATGPRTVTLQEFDEAYTGVVLTMEPGPGFVREGRSLDVFKALQTRLQSSLNLLIYCVIAGFLLVVPGLVTPVFTQVFVDDILSRGMQDWLKPLLLGIIFNAVLMWVLKSLQLLFLRRLKIKLAIEMSGQFLWHTLRLPLGFFAQRNAGEVTSRLDLNDKVAEALSGKLATTVIGLFMLVFYVGVMCTYDLILTGLGVGLALINFVVLQLSSRRRVDANLKLGLEMGKAAGVSITGLQSIETLKASGLESDFFARWSGYYTKALNTFHGLAIQERVIGVIPSLLSMLTMVAFLTIGGLQVMEGELTLGMLVAFLSLMQAFQAPVANLVNLGSTIQELVGDMNRLDDLLGNPVDAQVEDRSPAAPQRLEGYVELRGITFGYSPLERPLIVDFSLKVQPGQRIALVGGSGSGKSTIARLLTGLYQPWQGQILFDHRSRQETSRVTLTHSLAMIDQDVFIFAGTVRENLTLWDSTVPDGDLLAACRDAAIHEVISALPQGYDTPLLEGGGNLSGGQRQRLEIARALLSRPSILVMDEATSALDVKTEREIDQNLRRRGCTCILIAHRLSTIRDCDEILVLQGGIIVERGSHQELWERGGAYTALLQSEGEILSPE